MGEGLVSLSSYGRFSEFVTVRNFLQNAMQTSSVSAINQQGLRKVKSLANLTSHIETTINK